MKKKSESLPLVSCLMVTQCTLARLKYFKESVNDFCRQTYKNKELIIVVDKSPTKVREKYLTFLKSLKREDIIWVYKKGKSTLGALRNRTIDNSRGDILCIWDDDDIHHPQRIEVEYGGLKDSGYGGIALRCVFHYFRDTGELHLLDLKKNYSQFLTGSLMCYKKFAPRYPPEKFYAFGGEDGAFCKRLEKVTSIGVITNAPSLYVYCAHGTNITGTETHRRMVNRYGVNKNYIIKNRKYLLEQLKEISLPPGIQILACNDNTHVEALIRNKNGTLRFLDPLELKIKVAI